MDSNCSANVPGHGRQTTKGTGIVEEGKSLKMAQFDELFNQNVPISNLLKVQQTNCLWQCL